MIPGIPGGQLSNRPLHFFWLADCSGSMAGAKIQALNNAIREAIPEMRRAADNNPNAQVLVRAIKFSSGAQWHIAQPTLLDQFQWIDLQAGGVTDMGRAFLLVAEQLKVPPMVSRGLPPVLVLVSDGHPTDDANRGLAAIMAEPWGNKAVRLAIGIGDDVDYNILQNFIGNPEISPCHANNSDQLAYYIKWASTVAIQASSSPNAQASTSQDQAALAPTQLAIPAPSPMPGGQSQDVF
ncbi:MAG TPA: VWA domain-containing protein [Ktedonobacteraceae bacterium]|nr:VWA domain-containing protein [Ktedonobacteraceae bacterium]